MKSLSPAPRATCGRHARRAPCYRAALRSASVQERFWSKVDRSGGPHACSLWQGAITSSGYGNFGICGRRICPAYAEAHHVAFELTYGPIRKSFVIAHRCGNKACCNPRHLFETEWSEWGEHASKLGFPQSGPHHWSRREPEQTMRGSRNGAAILTESALPRIRRLIASGVNYREIGRRFGVTGANIWCIAKRISWKHVPGVAT